MKKRSLFSKPESACLRQKLEECLTAIFAGDKIGKYMATDPGEPHLQLLMGNTDHAAVFPCIKSAYHIWLNMYPADRHAVLAKFQRLCAGILIRKPGSSKTLVFCALFINEFAGILTSTMEWPD